LFNIEIVTLQLVVLAINVLRYCNTLLAAKEQARLASSAASMRDADTGCHCVVQ
jgi:hypothetical protein